MQQNPDKYSRDALNNFLDFASEKGLLKRATAQARKQASAVVLGILDQNEAADITKINLDDVIQRHRNRATGKIIPKTLATYESRTRIAVGDFLNYVKNPSAWKPSQQRKGKKGATTLPTGKTLENKDLKGSETTGQPSVHIDFQIHISPEASPEQIDQIFESMRRHLYRNTASN